MLALTGTGSYYGKTMTRGLDLGAKHIAELGGPTFNYVYLDHKSWDPAAGVQAMAELISKDVQAKFASYGDDIGAMLTQTTENKMFTLDGGGGTGTFAQGKPYFWGTRAITPNDTLPGVFRWFKEKFPDKKTVGVMAWDAGAEINESGKKDVLQKIADAGLEFNGLYELVPIGGQDFSQVLPKIKDNEPDLLLTGHYGQDPGSFSNQAATAGLKALRMGFEFTRTASTRPRAHTTRRATSSPTTTSIRRARRACSPRSSSRTSTRSTARTRTSTPPTSTRTRS